jgi:hypothetical protein
MITLWLASMMLRWNSRQRLLRRDSFGGGSIFMKIASVMFKSVSLPTAGAVRGQPFHVAAKVDVVKHGFVVA